VSTPNPYMDHWEQAAERLYGPPHWGPTMLAYHVCFRGPELCKRVLKPPWASSDLDLVRWGLHLAFEYGGATEIVNVRA